MSDHGRRQMRNLNARQGPAALDVRSDGLLDQSGIGGREESASHTNIEASRIEDPAAAAAPEAPLVSSSSTPTHPMLRRRLELKTSMTG